MSGQAQERAGADATITPFNTEADEEIFSNNKNAAMRSATARERLEFRTMMHTLIKNDEIRLARCLLAKRVEAAGEALLITLNHFGDSGTFCKSELSSIDRNNNNSAHHRLQVGRFLTTRP